MDGVAFVSDGSWETASYDYCFEPVGNSSLISADVSPNAYQFPEELVLPVSDRLKDESRLVNFGRE